MRATLPLSTLLSYHSLFKKPTWYSAEQTKHPKLVSIKSLWSFLFLFVCKADSTPTLVQANPSKYLTRMSPVLCPWHTTDTSPSNYCITTHTALLITPPAQALSCPILWLRCNHSFNICILCSSKGERNEEILQESLTLAVFNCLLLPSYVIAPSMLGTFQTFRQLGEKNPE